MKLNKQPWLSHKDSPSPILATLFMSAVSQSQADPLQSSFVALKYSFFSQTVFNIEQLTLGCFLLVSIN